MKLKKKDGLPMLPVPDSGPYQLQPARCKTKLTPEEALKRFSNPIDDIGSNTFVGEQKFDGIRYLWQIAPGNEKHNFLTSRRISEVTGKFVQKEDKVPLFRDVEIPELKNTVFDGEFTGGKMSSDTQHEMAEGRGSYNVWDILVDKGRDVRSLPLWARQELLVDRLRALPSSIEGRVNMVEGWSNLSELNKEMQETDCEGFVVKLLESSYGEGWIKVPYDGFLEDCVIIGYEPSLEGKYADKGWIGAITVGQWVPQWFANKVKAKPVKLKKSGLALIEVGTCSGFDDKLREKLSNPVEQARHKYLAVEIKYKMRFENTGRFRHIRFSRFRHDKNSSDCIWTPKKPVK